MPQRCTHAHTHAGDPLPTHAHDRWTLLARHLVTLTGGPSVTGLSHGPHRTLTNLSSRSHRTSQPHFPSTPNPSPPPPPRSFPAALALSILRPRHGVSPLPAQLRLLQPIFTTVGGPPPFRVIHLSKISQGTPAGDGASQSKNSSDR